MIKRFLALGILILCLVFYAGNSFGKELKLGYVSMRKVFYEYTKTKDFNTQLEKEDEGTKKEIEKMTETLRKLRDEMDLLSAEAREKKEPEVRQKIKELDDFRREKVETFIKKKDEMFKEIRNDIMDVVTAYAKKNGYDIVFDEAAFVYSAESYDITDTIVKELNK